MYKKLKIEFVEAQNVVFNEDGLIDLKAKCRSYDPEYQDSFDDDNHVARHEFYLVPLTLNVGVAFTEQNIIDAILAKEGYTQSY